MTYKAIGFDYGGVIGGGGNSGEECNRRICKLLEIDKAYYKEVYYTVNHLINTGKVETWREFWKIFIDKIGQPEKFTQLMEISDWYGGQLLIVDKRLLSLSDVLRNYGYTTGLLSNNIKEMGIRLREKGIDKHFDVFHISAETGLMKPRPEAFKFFADSLGVVPEELIFIDDAEKSLSTAEESGFTPLLFESYEKLLTQLGSLGITVK